MFYFLLLGVVPVAGSALRGQCVLRVWDTGAALARMFSEYHFINFISNLFGVSCLAPLVHGVAALLASVLAGAAVGLGQVPPARTAA